MCAPDSLTCARMLLLQFPSLALSICSSLTDHSNQQTDVLQNISLWKTFSESHVGYTRHFDKCYFLSFSRLCEVEMISFILWDEGVTYAELGTDSDPYFLTLKKHLAEEMTKCIRMVSKEHTPSAWAPRRFSPICLWCSETVTPTPWSLFSQLKYEEIGKFAIIPWNFNKLPFYNVI